MIVSRRQQKFSLIFDAPGVGRPREPAKKPPYGQFPATSFRWLTDVAYVSRLWDLRCNLRNFTQAGRLFVPGRLGDGWTAGWQIFRWSAPSEVLIVLVDMIRLPLSWKPSCPHSWKLDICAVGTPDLDSSLFFGPNFPISNFDIFDSRHSRLPGDCPAWNPLSQLAACCWMRVSPPRRSKSDPRNLPTAFGKQKDWGFNKLTHIHLIISEVILSNISFGFGYIYIYMLIYMHNSTLMLHG